MQSSAETILITTLAAYQTRFWIPVAQRLRNAGCITMTADLAGMERYAGPPVRDGGARIPGTSLHVGVVTSMEDDARARAFFESKGVPVRTIGSAALGCVQVQDVWLAPDLRGRGYAVPLIAAAVEQIMCDVGQLVTLYVNDFNTAARAAYRRVGFVEAGEFMTVLL